jgi:hypothetical protein
MFRNVGIEVSDSDDDTEHAGEKDDEVVNPEAVDTFSLDDPIRMYLKEISRVALLRKEQEVEYARLIERTRVPRTPSPSLRPSFVASVDARVVSVDPRGNWG